MSRKYELKVTSEPENLARIAEFITDSARTLGLGEDEVFAVEMAVDEACANVIEHAYGGEPGGSIEITCALEADRFEVTIHDYGEAFDPEKVPCPDTCCSLEEREVGGLGVYFMKTLMDEVRFEFDSSKGNTLTMTKVMARP